MRAVACMEGMVVGEGKGAREVFDVENVGKHAPVVKEAMLVV